MTALRKPLSLLLVAVLVAGLLAGFSMARPATARSDISIPPIPGIPDPCGLLPDGTSQTICKAATNPVGTAVGAIPGIPSASDIASKVANATLKPILNSLAQEEGSAVLAALKYETNFLNSSTTPDLTKTWYLDQYRYIFGMSVAIALFMLFYRGGKGFKDNDLGEAGKAGAGIMVFLVLGGILPFLVASILKVTDDEMAPAWMQHASGNTDNTLNSLQVDFSNKLSVLSSIGAILLPIIFLMLGVVGGVAMELMLLVREAFIYVVTAFEVAVIALAVGGRVGGNLVWKCTMTLIAAIFFKLYTAIILTLSLGLLANGGGGDPVLLGSVMLVTVPLSVWAVWRAISGHYSRPPHQVLWNSAAIVGARSMIRAKMAG